jgi:Zn-dependent peptidase ImmA (M78 family)
VRIKKEVNRMLNAAQIEEKAQRLLDRAGVAGPPVPVESIARVCGAVIRYELSTSDVSGALYRKHERIIIGVNAAHHRNRQRFTIAHELGHLELHDAELHVDHHFVAETRSRRPETPLLPQFRRDRASTEATDPREIEANRYAAALLMPAAFLDKGLLRFRGPLKESDVATLADEYEVSAQAMAFRLINLGVPIDASGSDEAGVSG